MIDKQELRNRGMWETIKEIEALEAENTTLKAVQNEVAAIELRDRVADAELGRLVRRMPELLQYGPIDLTCVESGWHIMTSKDCEDCPLDECRHGTCTIFDCLTEYNLPTPEAALLKAYTRLLNEPPKSYDINEDV